MSNVKKSKWGPLETLKRWESISHNGAHISNHVNYYFKAHGFLLSTQIPALVCGVNFDSYLLSWIDYQTSLESMTFNLVVSKHVLRPIVESKFVWFNLIHILIVYSNDLWENNDYNDWHNQIIISQRSRQSRNLMDQSKLILLVEPNF